MKYTLVVNGKMTFRIQWQSQ